MFRHILNGSVAALALMATMPAIVMAQETTSSIRGSVVGPNGEPVAGAVVTITHVPTGSTTTVTSGPGGNFIATGLRVGGPYSIKVTGDAYRDLRVQDVFLNLGETTQLAFTLEADPSAAEIVVEAASAPRTVLAIGPSVSFDRDALDNAPSIARDLRDVIRNDPRIYVDDSFVDAVQCAGANPRFNSLTVDGVRKNDGFGLNSNGFPTERQPFPFDSIEQVSVELAPFDVQYGGFTACNVNAVTKSGTNQFHGTFFYDYTDDSLRADKLEGQPVDNGEFEEKRWGAALGGPIIPNRLFFFAAYEYLEGANIFDRGPAGSGAARIVPGLTQADLDDITTTAQTTYGYDPGGTPRSEGNEDEKILIKLDANILDNHRLSLIYNRNDGFNITASDNGNTEFEFRNHLYERGAILESYTGLFFSDWTENFSTEVRIGYSDLDNRQIPLGGTDFGEVQITVAGNTIYLGADDSRHANKLNYENISGKIAGKYTWNNNLVTVGYEYESYDVFNLFIQEAEGEYRFPSIAAFQAGTPSLIIYENAAPSNVPSDAAAEFAYAIHTAYIQDELFLEPYNTALTFGLRYDWYTSDDTPRNNPNVQARYGFSSQENLDGKDLILPRFGFTLDATENLRFQGGIGRFSGGNPNVWISNNYSNDGITQVEATLSGAAADFAAIPVWVGDEGGLNRPIFGVPEALFNAVGVGVADSGVNVLDPDFEIPSLWKYSLGFTYSFANEHILNVDFLHQRSENSAIVRVLNTVQIGTIFDGRPRFKTVNFLDPDCLVDPALAACATRTQDFVLTNVIGEDARATVFSIGLSKDYDFGLGWNVGYAWTDAQDVSPMTSSVAFSNYDNLARSNAQNPGLSTSDYEIENRFTFQLEYEKAFFFDLMSTFTLRGEVSSGQPYSFVFDGGLGTGDPTGFNDRELLYVPTSAADPNVVFGGGFDTAAFFNFVNSSGLSQYAGGIAPRNAFKSDSFTRVDFRFEQELPGVLQSHRSAVFLVIENLTNLINDEWGIRREFGFPGTVDIVDATYDAVNNRYNFNTYVPRSQSRIGTPSQWEIRFGAKYEF